MNIELTSCSKGRDIYEQMLHIYERFCHVTEPTRKGKNLTDHISTNIIKIKILYSNVLPYLTTSDHEFIRNLRNFDQEPYISDFKTLRFTTVYSFDDTDDILDTLNKLILTAID